MEHTQISNQIDMKVLNHWEPVTDWLELRNVEDWMHSERSEEFHFNSCRVNDMRDFKEAKVRGDSFLELVLRGIFLEGSQTLWPGRYVGAGTWRRSAKRWFLSVERALFQILRQRWRWCCTGPRSLPCGLGTKGEDIQAHTQKVSYLLPHWRGNCVHIESKPDEHSRKLDSGPPHTAGLLPGPGYCAPPAC